MINAVIRACLSSKQVSLKISSFYQKFAMARLLCRYRFFNSLKAWKVKHYYLNLTELIIVKSLTAFIDEK